MPRFFMPKAQPIKQTETCFHCGENCIDEVLHYDQHNFCCHGCKTVYTMLNETGLVSYYEIEEKAPGKTVKSDHSNKAYLDLEEVKSRMLDFKEGNQCKITFYLPSMHCAACIWLLERMERIHIGIQRSEVNFLRKSLTVFYQEDKISLKELVILLEDLGYPPDIQRDLGQNKPKNPEQRKLILKLGVAGFAFGNIMLFSFPEYLSIEDASLEAFSVLFGYLNLLLAIPVLVYSDTDYLKSAWKSLRLGYLSIDVPIALGIITLFGRSTYEVLSGAGAGYFDSFAGLIFFLLIGKWFQSTTYEALAFDRDFRSYFPIAVTKLNGIEEQACMLENIKVGDRLKILNNQVVPADAVLMKGLASIDYSFVNGESSLVQKIEGDFLYAGGRQTGGAIEVEVVKEVSQSYLTGLWNQSSFDKENGSSRFTGLIDKVSRVFSAAILTIALLTLGLRWWLDLGEAFNAFTAVLIIACPCALALSMPFAMGNVSRVLGKLGLFVKNTITLEKMARISTVVFDKTGTLTNAKNTNVTFNGEVLSMSDLALIKAAVSNSTHPLSIAIKYSIKEVAVSPISEFSEEPGKGIKGVHEGKEIKLGAASMGVGAHIIAEKMGQALVHVWLNDSYKGHFAIQKELRKGIHALVAHLKLRYSTQLLSGDNDADRYRMEHLFGNTQALKFNQTPIDKLTHVKQLRESGEVVMMLGDGLNDAGALKEADVGMAVADDVFSFSPACDAILQADQLRHLGDYLKYIQTSMNVVKGSVIISLLYNVIGLYFAVRGELTPVVAAILMPLSSVSVVVFVSFLTNVLKPKV
jgi:Cu+-exporting ATPase